MTQAASARGMSPKRSRDLAGLYWLQEIRHHVGIDSTVSATFSQNAFRSSSFLGDATEEASCGVVASGRLDLGHEPCPCQTNVFNLLLATRKIDQETVNNMRSWVYSGFSVDKSVYREGRFLFKWGEYGVEKGSIFHRPILNVRTFRPLRARLYCRL